MAHSSPSPHPSCFYSSLSRTRAGTEQRRASQESGEGGRRDFSSAAAHLLQDVLAGKQELQAIRFLGQVKDGDLELVPR